MLRQAVVFCALVALATAFLEITDLDPIPEKYKSQTGCYIKELDLVIPFGKNTPSKERCVEYRCTPGRVTVAGCSVAVAAAPCRIVEQKEKLYPHCCPNIECPKSQQVTLDNV